MSYPIEEIEGIGPAFREKLAPLGITKTEHFLKLCCDKKGRSEVALKSGISETLLLKWANRADLMRIKGVAKQYSELLEAAGVDTVKELKQRVPANLTAALEKTNAEKKLCKVTPKLADVTAWIEAAKTLPPTITH
jgi:predicted flap endonuclease-1-like 5' DNA nuclease